jgi:predicted Rossmann-fold nucleotide-binding protein
VLRIPQERLLHVRSPGIGLRLLRLVGAGSRQLRGGLAEGFIALPGGLGTLEELAEVATWSQLGLHRKPVVLLDVEGFWSPLVTQLDRMVEAGLLKPGNRRILGYAPLPEEALRVLATARPPAAESWISGDQR